MRRVRNALIGFLLVGQLGCSSTSDREATAKTHDAFVNDGRQKVVASTPSEAAQFGNSLSISGVFAAVGSSGDNGKTGAAFLFERSGPTWALKQRIVAPDGAPLDEFGQTIAISGDTLAVGSPGADVGYSFGASAAISWNAGAVYIYRNTGDLWTFSQKLSTAGQNVPQAPGLGRSLSLEADALVAGDGLCSHAWNRSGTNFVYVQSFSGLLDQGYASAISGNLLLLGALAPGAPGSAGVYVYVRPHSGVPWELEQLMTSRPTGSGFGSSLALSGDTALIGSNDPNSPNARFGVVEVYTRLGLAWSRQQALVAPDGAAGDQFGASLKVLGDRALVGAPGHAHVGGRQEEGSAYLFERSGTQWTEQRELRAVSGGDRDHFGRAVALSADAALVGTPDDDNPFRAQGSAYFFALDRSGPQQCVVCQQDLDCVAGKYCDASGVCLPQKALGRACEDADCRSGGCQVCASGFCASGFCCDQACRDPGLACSAALTTRPNGTCAPSLGSSFVAKDNGAGTGGKSADGPATTGPSSGGTRDERSASGSSDNGGGSGGSGNAGFSLGGASGTGAAVVGAADNTTPCIRVSPTGNDAAGAVTNGEVPFRHLDVALAFVEAHQDVPRDVCVASGLFCGSTAEYDGPQDADFRIGSFVSVRGRYEAINWTRCADSVTRLLPKTGNGMVFDTPYSFGMLDGFEIVNPAAAQTSAVTIVGGSGVRLIDISMPERTTWPGTTPDISYGVLIDGNPEVVIENSHLYAAPGKVSTVGVRVADSRLQLSGSSVRAVGRSAVALEIDDCEQIELLGNVLTATGSSGGGFAEAVDAFGDIHQLVMTDNILVASGMGQTVTGVTTASVGLVGVELSRNHIHVEGDRDLTGVSLVGGGALVRDNTVEMVGTGTGVAVGIQCDGFGDAAQCREISRNTVTGPTCSGSCAYDTTGLLVVGSNTLVDSNRVKGGCSSGAAWSSAVGLRAAGEMRVQNNVLIGATCPAGQGVQGFGVVVDPEAEFVDLNSNYLDAGTASGAGCTTTGVKLTGGPTSIGNNIIVPGSCGTAFNLDRALGVPSPSLASNDLAPGSPTALLYRIAGDRDATTVAAVNALSGATGNFAASCPFRLPAGSPCIDAGTPFRSAPDYDIDGESRSLPSDVGPDEFHSTADGCGSIAVDVQARSVQSARFSFDFSNGVSDNPEELDVLKWAGGQNLTSVLVSDRCTFSALEHFGNAWTPPDPLTGGHVLVGSGSAGTWEPDGASIFIRSQASGCAGTLPIPVETRYFFRDTVAPDSFGVERRFDFASAPFNERVRAFIPRLTASFDRTLHPNATGSTLQSENATSCTGGCLVTDWNDSWFALYASSGPVAGSGMVVLRKPSASDASLWVDVDDDSTGGSNASSAVLEPPAGGFRGELLEQELFCFFDANTWPAAQQAALRLPAGCTFDLACTNGATASAVGAVK